MTYALTNQARHFYFLSSSSADLVSKIIQRLKFVGWTSVATITGGETLRGVSPQGYSVYVDIYRVSSNRIALKPKSSVGSGAVGLEHTLFWATGYVYQIHCGPCYYFISRPGVAFDNEGSACCCSIPYLSTSCGLGTSPVSEVWWQMADFVGSPFVHGYNPRTAIGLPHGGLFPSQLGCINGVTTTATGLSANDPQILRLSSLDDEFTFFHISNPVLSWPDGTDFPYPAFILWDKQIIGQVYDAACRSLPVAMDTERTWDNLNWKAYTDMGFLGTLWLLRNPDVFGSRSNYVY